MKGLEDFLQAASNSAADTVAAPVDLISWLTRKAGVPINEPVGGSDWMRRVGLKRDVRQSAESLAGETAAMVSPLAMAAKAPQIARGMLSLDDAAMDSARRGIEGYMNSSGMAPKATVWHGSPHSFDRFDASKIGTGEGAQAYGHGLYLAENPDVAKTYMGPGKSIGGASFENKLSKMMEKAQDAGRYGEAGALEELLINRNPAMAYSKFSVENGYSPDRVAEAHAVIKQFENKFQPAGLYKVDLPDEQIAKMLDWDKPLATQPQAARDVFAAAMKKDGYESYVVDGQRVYLGLGEEATLTGRDAYRRLHEHAIRGGKAEPAAVKEKEMVGWLRNAGVPGIRYLDGGSRGAGTGTSNYVVFPGEESLLKILERNGKPIK